MANGDGEQLGPVSMIPPVVLGNENEWRAQALWYDDFIRARGPDSVAELGLALILALCEVEVSFQGEAYLTFARSIFPWRRGTWLTIGAARLETRVELKHRRWKIMQRNHVSSIVLGLVYDAGNQR